MIPGLFALLESIGFFSSRQITTYTQQLGGYRGKCLRASVYVELVSCQKSLAEWSLLTASTKCLLALGWWLVLISHPGGDTETQRRLICMLDLQQVRV